MSTKTTPAPGIPSTGPQARRPTRDRPDNRLSVPSLSVVLTVAVGVSSSHLPPPPLTGDELGTWAGELGPTAAAFALVRVVLAVLALRLWATVALVALVRSLPRARSVRRLGPIAEAVGGRIAREWVRAALGVGVASTLLIPSPAAATETTAAVEAPLLERIDDEVDPGPRTTPSPPASESEEAGRRGSRTDPPRLVLVEPPSAEPTTTSTSDSPPQGEGAPGGRERGGTEPGGAGRSPSTVPRHGPVRHGQDPGEGAPHIPAGSGGEHGERPGRSPEAGPSTRRDANTDPDHSGPPPWTISPGEHLWHVAEATAAELAPGATTADVAEYHRRLVAANAANLPVPGNPDLVFAGNVIVRPAWVPPA